MLPLYLVCWCCATQGCTSETLHDSVTGHVSCADHMRVRLSGISNPLTAMLQRVFFSTMKPCSAPWQTNQLS